MRLHSHRPLPVGRPPFRGYHLLDKRDELRDREQGGHVDHTHPDPGRRPNDRVHPPQKQAGEPPPLRSHPTEGRSGSPHPPHRYTTHGGLVQEQGVGDFCLVRLDVPIGLLHERLEPYRSRPTKHVRFDRHAEPHSADFGFGGGWQIGQPDPHFNHVDRLRVLQFRTAEHIDVQG